MSRAASCATWIVAWVFTCAAVAGNVIYVNASAPLGGDGQSWETAFVSLQDGLATAVPGSGDQVWVAAGEYKPAPPNGDRSISFQLKSGVGVYGGFAAGETSLEERDWVKNPTILSGDLNGNDVGEIDDPSRLENSSRVVVASNTNSLAVLDGFTVTAGDTRNSTVFNGAGIFSVNGAATVRHCIIRRNLASQGAGTECNTAVCPTFSDCKFPNNRAYGVGAGAVIANVANLNMQDCTFSDGVALRGTGLFLHNTHANLTRCSFINNVVTDLTSTGGGAGVYVNFGSAFLFAEDCLFRGNSAFGGAGAGLFAGGAFIGCVFEGNSGSYGPAMTLAAESGESSSVINCIFRGNSSNVCGALHNQSSPTTVVNCLFTGNTSFSSGAAICCVGSTAATTMLVNCTLSGNSSNNVVGGVFNSSSVGPLQVVNSILWGNSGFFGSGESAQIGFAGPPPAVSYSCIQGWTGSLGGAGNLGLDPMFVDANGPDNTVGTEDDDLHLSMGSPSINRSNPLLQLPHPVDLDGEPRVQECIADQGTYESSDPNPFRPDCNNNGVQDACDIAAQTSSDCNLNTVPDLCDIAAGSSFDIDINGIPDECQGVPLNNACNTSQIIQAGSHVITNLHATTDGPAGQNNCGFPDGQIHNDVWFRYVAQCAGIVTINLCNVNFDARLAVYIGCPSEGSQPIACSDDACGLAPRVTFQNAGPLLYRIRVGGAPGSVGGGPMVISCTPSPQCPGDADGNGSVNIADLLMVISNWGQSGLNPADVNGDSIVNVADLLAVIAGWGACP